LVVQDILKEIAQTQQVDVNAKHRFKGESRTNPHPRVEHMRYISHLARCKLLIPPLVKTRSITDHLEIVILCHTLLSYPAVVIINEADSLSRDAQSALRRTMEKYMGNLRLILCATSTSKIIAPIRSRCLLMRVGSPNAGEMLKCLKHVSKKENFFLPDEVANAIYEDSNGNLRKAILVLETLKSQNKDLMKLQNKPDIGIAKPDWEIYSNETAEMIIKVQSPEQLLLVRARMYELLVHAIPPRLILKTLADYLVTKVDESIKEKVIEKAAMFVSRKGLIRKVGGWALEDHS